MQIADLFGRSHRRPALMSRSIILLEDEKIADVGTLDELLNVRPKCGLFGRLISQ